MTQEEKANAYDESIRIAKKKYKMVQNLCEDSQIDVDFLKDALTDIFPKLEDEIKIEDEKIRQDLILFLDTFWHLGKNANFDKWSTADCADWITWVGKQDKKVDVIEGFDTEFEKQVSSLLASVINKNDEYTEGLVKWASQSLLGYAKHEIEKQGEQKSAWSEKDGRNLQGIIDEIKANKNAAPDYDLATYDRFLSWLESLQDRFSPMNRNLKSDNVAKPNFNFSNLTKIKLNNHVY